MSERRILLKLSGELLCGPGGFGVEPDATWELAQRIRKGLESSQTEVALVIGGGNFLRGAKLSKASSADGERVIDRVTGDHMGMLATIMNALGLRAALEKAGVEARVLSALAVPEVVEPFERRRALEHLARGRLLIFAGGTGHPYFTTDTTASLRALQIGATQLAKGTKVRGIFSDDPVKNPAAEFFPSLSYRDVLERRLEVMDAAAISLCMENGLAVQVFDMWKEGNLERVLAGEVVGTIVRS
ncbi:MAG TPA: UMP kinase [Planctomycetota bacterium]|nr:UMP kinase [Planctomycetota bacterium]